MKILNLFNPNLKNFHLILILFFFNFIIHFLPFLRFSVAPDDYAQIGKEYIGLQNLLRYPESAAHPVEAW